MSGERQGMPGERPVKFRWSLKSPNQVKEGSSKGQTHSKRFHCTYVLHYYPFDTQVKQINQKSKMIFSQYDQVCFVHFQLKRFDRESVKLEPKHIEMLSKTELTQYSIKVIKYII